MDALVELFTPLDRQGPGDVDFSLELMHRLPELTGTAPIGDFGCGTGVTALPLARHFNRKVIGVDLSADFLNVMEQRAKEEGLASLVQALRADFGSVNPEEHQFSLIWSEGAAYALTFSGALQAWRPLLVEDGLLVVSELTWLTENAPAMAQEFWHAGYPEMRTEPDNMRVAEECGYEVLGTERLPQSAWWDNYYSPLKVRINELEPGADDVMQAVISEMKREIHVFEHSENSYGYTFYILRKREKGNFSGFSVE